MKHFNTTHGMTNTRTYKSWINMKHRCLNQKARAYKNYGGRGIVICKKWERFENFLSDMGECPPNLSLDRIDCNKGYQKDNCRWVTLKQQQRNKRSTMYLTYKGRRYILVEFAETFALDPQVVRQRLRNKNTLLDLARPPRWSTNLGSKKNYQYLLGL